MNINKLAVRKLRRKLKLTQKEFGSEYFGVGQNTVSQWESGASRPEGKSAEVVSTLIKEHLDADDIKELRAAAAEEALEGPNKSVVVLDKIEYGKILGKMEYAEELNREFISRIEGVLRHTEEELVKLVPEKTRAGPVIAQSKR